MAQHVEIRKSGNGQEPLFTAENPGFVAPTIAGAAVSPSNPEPVDITKVGGEDVVADEPAPVTPAPTTGQTTGQVALSNAAAQIVAANASRRRGRIKATVDWYAGLDNTVVAAGAAGGYLVYAGETYDLDGHVGAVFGILASGTGTAFFEQRVD